MRAVVIGGSGQIGGWLLHHLWERGHEAVGTACTTQAPGLAPLDAGRTDEAVAWLVAQAPEVVFYPAGWTWVDGCERDPQRALAANCDQPLALARAAAGLGARFVLFSSDYVFDGESGPNREDDPPAPLNAYGRAKLAAEAALAEALDAPQWLVVRTSWVYGPEVQGKNFAYQVLGAIAQGRVLDCPSDMRSSPSYGPDVALATVRLAEDGRSGLWHVAGPETIARDAFARAIARAFDLDQARVRSRPYAETAAPDAAPRPLSGGLRTERLDAFAPGLMRPLETALADFHARAARSHRWRKPLAPI